MHKVVVISDTSSLIALSRIGELEVLQRLYGEIFITPEISSEFGEDLPKWLLVKAVNDKNLIEVLKIELDLGESSAIALAMEIGNKESLLIIDERKGRAKAKALGLKITGLMGVLVKAKKMGEIESLKSILSALEECEFRISEHLKKQVLNEVGEN